MINLNGLCDKEINPPPDPLPQVGGGDLELPLHFKGGGWGVGYF